MVSVASQSIEEVCAHAQSDGLEDAREICADGTYFPNYLRMHMPSFLSCVANSRGRKSPGGYCAVSLLILMFR